MSKRGYNAYGVPWYASSDTPAIRDETPCRKSAEAKARSMRKVQDRYRAIAEWKPGDRFIHVKIMHPMENEEHFQYYARKGTFLSYKRQGLFYFVTVLFDPDSEWDEEKPQTQTKMGLAGFIDCVHKWDDELAAEIPCWGAWWADLSHEPFTEENAQQSK